jgi:uncharacterized protein YggT (Ycf19 family)
MSISLAILPFFVRNALNTVLWLLSTLVFVAALASWIPQVRQSQIGYYLHRFTEPVIAPVRALLRRIPGLDALPIDLSPLATLLLIQLLQRIVWFL